jgi:D-threonate/D-erythronate kinase
VLGLIADDLTGASDAAVQFARRGWETLLVLDMVRLTTVARSILAGVGSSRTVTQRVLAVTTDSRALSNASAEKLTADALCQLMDAGVDRIYLKIDSTMRGSVPGQIAGALAVWRTRYANASAVVCPAYPRMGRTVAANRVLVYGQPVHQSSFGVDPVSPVNTNDLASLIPDSLPAAASHISQALAPIVVTDATSDEDLANIADQIVGAGPSVIPVGSAGLAAAMAASLSVRTEGPVVGTRRIAASNPHILILVTSLNPVSRRQIERVADAFPDVIILLTPAERVAGKSVAESLAQDLAAHVAREKWDVLGVVGGDGARAALRRLDASAIRIHDTILEGIPIGTIVGGLADGLPIFTKAGGFGDEDALVRVVERIKNG